MGERPPVIVGLSEPLRRASVAMLDVLLALPGLDDDVHRRVQWLRWGLSKYDPVEEAMARWCRGEWPLSEG